MHAHMHFFLFLLDPLHLHIYFMMGLSNSISILLDDLESNGSVDQAVENSFLDDNETFKSNMINLSIKKFFLASTNFVVFSIDTCIRIF